MTFTPEEIERIEYLKDPKHAQALGILHEYRQEDYDLLKKVGILNLVIFFGGAYGWEICHRSTIWDSSKTYIVKSDFVPGPQKENEKESEFPKFLIKRQKNCLGCSNKDTAILPSYFSFIPLHALIECYTNDYRFCEFICEDNIIRQYECIPALIDSGKKVYAVFKRRSEKNKEIEE